MRDAKGILLVFSLVGIMYRCQDPAGNRTFFSKSKILEKVVKQVQDDSATQRICTRVSETRPKNHAFASRTNPRHVGTLGFAWILSSNV